MGVKQGTSGAQGVSYEIRMLMYFLVRAYMLGLKEFKLKYQETKAGQLDDIYLDTGDGQILIIQLKHKERKDLKIQAAQLFNDGYNTGFNLLKYMKAYKTATLNLEFEGKITGVVLTTIDFDLRGDEMDLVKNRRKWYDEKQKSIKLQPVTMDDSFSRFLCQGQYYRFANQDVVEILQRQKKAFEEQNQIKQENLTNDEILEALDNLYYGVKQDSVDVLESTIKKLIADCFKNDDVDTIYANLEIRCTNWCNTKVKFGQNLSTDKNVERQNELVYADINKFFKEFVKKVWFRVPAATIKFIGRSVELDNIRAKFEKEFIVTISGFEGIGKTELAKKFCKEHGRKVFNGRVIWIEAGKDDTVISSFVQLAKELRIEDASVKEIEMLIEEVFHYFKGFKVLFVFDNFDRSSEYEGKLVNRCLEIANDSSCFRPYFLFTSRNQDYVPGSIISLEKLSLEDAKAFIQNRVKLTDGDTKRLAITLKCFPLALKLATAYIKQQQEEEEAFEDDYNIKDYFAKFKRKRRRDVGLTDANHHDPVGKYLLLRKCHH